MTKEAQAKRAKEAKAIVDNYQFPFDKHYEASIAFVKDGFDAGYYTRDQEAQALVEAIQEAQKYSTQLSLNEKIWDFLCGKVFPEALKKFKGE